MLVLLAVAAAAALAGAGLALLTQPPAKPGGATGGTVASSTTPQRAVSSAPVSHRPSASSSARSSAASAGQVLGGIAAGTQDCAYSSNDGTYLAQVEVSHSVCRDVASALAKGGQYWWPVPYEAPAEADLQASSKACSLTGEGMTMSIYDFRSNAPNPALGGVANSVCQKEEAAGWLPS